MFQCSDLFILLVFILILLSQYLMFKEIIKLIYFPLFYKNLRSLNCCIAKFFVMPRKIVVTVVSNKSFNALLTTFPLFWHLTSSVHWLFFSLVFHSLIACYKNGKMFSPNIHTYQSTSTISKTGEPELRILPVRESWTHTSHYRSAYRAAEIYSK